MKTQTVRTKYECDVCQVSVFFDHKPGEDVPLPEGWICNSDETLHGCDVCARAADKLKGILTP